jgi:hypothetical protein
MTTPHITLVREQLLATLADLRNRENPMEVDRARAVAQVASVLVDTAKVEVDYLKATGADRSDFLESAPTAPSLPGPSGTPTAHNPFPVSRTHRLEG